MNILLVGSGAREHAIAKAIKRSKKPTNIFCFASNNNPGIKELSSNYKIGKITDTKTIADFAKDNNIDFAIIGPEAPLEAGVVDKLKEQNIPSIGPTKKLAQLETSKSFTRNLLRKYNIPGGPKYKYFSDINGVKEFIDSLGGNYVVKADGLMGGKGVKVSGDHLQSIADGIAFCEELIAQDGTFLIEEKLIGQEFSLLSFSDGNNLAHMIAIQDHKRAFVNDTGPNTGGMGSYSDSDHKLPFLTNTDIEQAHKINQATIKAIKDEFNEEYKGIIYGGFMATKNGVNLIEYNARFGDPECMNILSLLESDFVELCLAIIKGNLTQDHARFAKKASVCKYAVPIGYPDNPIKNKIIDVSAVENKELIHYASVDMKENELYETGSRTIAIVSVSDSISDAELIAESEIKKIKGPLFHREDIGTEELIEKRIKMMADLRK
ncbi:MAG: phosphoribosylamine--glycine ligase [Candidatus Magasanikbacteria bacterium RIFCSPHIGHO2_01_FULL_33_34]|uniref:Phosphoribosylamine--glycine ligase n=1 Tax=Candidatus Magasanikbacteria bacterium RIFCSPHIGHO2_01_FULL_33_34 TaxID=1798671 RepID=A0A1F6LHE0_9BACT|nr:MAG: phosphoribosylamine--glycine ligase [Candidatus Magasanikbacteria bacterium RIFCSPHIGHO2_01_FULL_33_34]OGH65090.1 MAG: phosphoribosylamine--glycine ligase [Candidatus Magasanikbacteria bacterium RIFCSPHIGHO2_02_FULL_33_17]OGH75366.1 MAG: phosphoribosylamine--glycine ligase [Candidatus Magasanikbacteria bacterium RIFCSPLOWO2_01_FULL_33_34]OGH81728.1 MAG: phosphoribosylamine--glycine ligase [Candidatus Magasanikbacteria bacterium RIFCSPLOWO2_12_FULL_34_7]